MGRGSGTDRNEVKTGAGRGERYCGSGPPGADGSSPGGPYTLIPAVPRTLSAGTRTPAHSPPVRRACAASHSPTPESPAPRPAARLVVRRSFEDWCVVGQAEGVIVRTEPAVRGAGQKRAERMSPVTKWTVSQWGERIDSETMLPSHGSAVSLVRRQSTSHPPPRLRDLSHGKSCCPLAPRPSCRRSCGQSVGQMTAVQMTGIRK